MDLGKPLDWVIEDIWKLFEIPSFFLPPPPPLLKDLFIESVRWGFAVGLVAGLFFLFFSKRQATRNKGYFGGLFLFAAVLCVAFGIWSWWLHFRTAADPATQLNIASDGAFSCFLGFLLVLIYMFAIEKQISIRKRTGEPPEVP